MRRDERLCTGRSATRIPGGARPSQISDGGPLDSVSTSNASHGSCGRPERVGGGCILEFLTPRRRPAQAESTACGRTGPEGRECIWRANAAGGQVWKLRTVTLWGGRPVFARSASGLSQPKQGMHFPPSRRHGPKSIRNDPHTHKSTSSKGRTSKQGSPRTRATGAAGASSGAARALRGPGRAGLTRWPRPPCRCP